MDNDMVSVTLAGPAKIDGKRRPAGATVTVSRGLARELNNHGLLQAGPAFDASDVMSASELDAAVKLAVAEGLEELIAAHAEELAAMKERAETAEAKAADLVTASAATAETMAKLEAALSAALSRADAADAKVAELEAAAKSNPKPASKRGGSKT